MMASDFFDTLQAASLQEAIGRLRKVREVIARTDWQTEEARQMAREVLAATKGEPA